MTNERRPMPERYYIIATALAQVRVLKEVFRTLNYAPSLPEITQAEFDAVWKQVMEWDRRLNIVVLYGESK